MNRYTDKCAKYSLIDWGAGGSVRVFQGACVMGGRGWPQSYLHTLGSWRRTGPGEMADCSQ